MVQDSWRSNEQQFLASLEVRQDAIRVRSMILIQIFEYSVTQNIYELIFSFIFVEDFFVPDQKLASCFDLEFP